MASWFQCFHCKKVSPLPNGAPAVCPLCISSKDQSLSQERFEEAHKTGSIFDWDPKNRDTVSSIRKSRKSRHAACIVEERMAKAHAAKYGRTRADEYHTKGGR